MNVNARNYYLDNIKAICIYSLFIWHSCEVFHCKEDFYIHGSPDLILTFIYCFVSPWIMGTMFFISGISSMLSLQKRTLKQFYMDRCKRLIKPTLFGLILFVPIQAYFVMNNHGIDNSGFIDSLTYFFTNYSDDMCGYNGEFTPAHLWYMCYLIAYTFILYPVIKIIMKNSNRLKIKKYVSWSSIIGVILVNFILCYGTSEETFLAFGLIFALGMILYDNKHFYDYIKKNIVVITCLAIAINIVASLALIHIRDLNSIWTFEYALCRFIWSCGRVLGILSSIGLGQKMLNKSNKVWGYLSRNSYNYYFLHMQVLIIVAYFVISYVRVVSHLQFVFILILSIIFTIIIVELFKRILPFKWGFELKK